MKKLSFLIYGILFISFLFFSNQKEKAIHTDLTLFGIDDIGSGSIVFSEFQSGIGDTGAFTKPNKEVDGIDDVGTSGFTAQSNHTGIDDIGSGNFVFSEFHSGIGDTGAFTKSGKEVDGIDDIGTGNIMVLSYHTGIDDTGALGKGIGDVDA